MYHDFKSRAEAVSAEVHRFTTKAEALDFIVDVLGKEGVSDVRGRYAVWADCPFLKGLDAKLLSQKVPGLRFDVARQVAADAKIGLSQMDWALAGTGTLVQNSTSVEQRLVSTLPMIHIALIATDRILSDLATLLTRVSPRECSYLALITGPSRTADIERVLTIGVHGPEQLIIVFVDELSGVN